MARLQENSYPERKLQDTNNPVVIVVDMINGFAVQGALADPAIEKTAGPIRKLLDQDLENLFVCDTHEPGCMEFDAFPEHCVKNSQEAQVIDCLADKIQKKIEKNSINTFTAPGFLEWLEAQPDRDFIITGCCTDLCVLQLALSLQSWIHQNDKKGMHVFLPVDCVDTYDIPGVHDAPSWNAFALANMAANGIQVCSTLD